MTEDERAGWHHGLDGHEFKCSLHSICTLLNKLLDFLIPSCKMAYPINIAMRNIFGIRH